MEYRVWCFVNPPSEATHYGVDSPKEGHALIETLAADQLTNPSIRTNVFGLEQLVEGDWEEWYDNKGRDVHEAFEKRGGIRGPARRGGDKPPPRRKQPPPSLPRPRRITWGPSSILATTSQGVPINVEVKAPKTPFGGTVLEAFGGNASVYLVFTHEEVKRLIERLLWTL